MIILPSLVLVVIICAAASALALWAGWKYRSPHFLFAAWLLLTGMAYTMASGWHEAVCCG